ncbi:hypothetical protein [Mycobacterium sp.]|uniref:hypothetical protein n=1 Tax=Mycobacterium sp. TaxID=1785 RepID=UPI003D6BE792
MTPRRFALICHRIGDGKAAPSIEWTYWASRQQAEQARDELTPCGPRCAGFHTVVGVVPNRHPARRGVNGEMSSGTYPFKSGNSIPLAWPLHPELRDLHDNQPTPRGR